MFKHPWRLEKEGWGSLEAGVRGENEPGGTQTLIPADPEASHSRTQTRGPLPFPALGETAIPSNKMK